MNFVLKERYFLVLGLAGYLIIFFITLGHHQPPLFDERVFIPNVQLFAEHGLTKEFLYNMDNQAPGPLYQFVHYPLRHLTHLTGPGIRLVNVFFLGLLILLLARILTFRGLQGPLSSAPVPGGTGRLSYERALTWSLCLIAVPMVWQVSGLALTEMPTMFCSILALLVLLLAVRAETSVIQSTLLALLAGFLSGLAILGRSPFLLLTLASFCLLYPDFRNIHRWRVVLLHTVVALSMAVPVFLIWHGLVPPQQAFVGAGGISVWHGLLAFAYAAMLTLIVAPRWYLFSRRILLGLVIFYFLFLLLNIYVLDYEYNPLSEALRKVMPAGFMRIYPYLISPVLAALALYFIGCCFYRAWQHRNDTIFLFILACGMLILATTAKVTHLFSTRYVAQAAPFLVLVMIGYDRPTAGRMGRLILGMAIGFLSMETYFQFH